MKLELIKTVRGTAKFFDKSAPISFSEDTEGYEGPQIILFPELTYQSVEGFGGAFTEAASTTLDK